MLERVKLRVAMALVGLPVFASLVLLAPASAQQTFDDKLPVFDNVPFAPPKRSSAQSVPVQPVVARCAKPNSPPIAKNIASWFSYDDYPALALREERSGKVQYRITVGKAGLPTRVVIVSSPYNDLAQATTRALLRRARFTPATRKCKVIASFYYGSVNWVIPQ